MSKTVKSRCRVVKYSVDSEKLWKPKGPRGAASSTGSSHRRRDVQSHSEDITSLTSGILV